MKQLRVRPIRDDLVEVEVLPAALEWHETSNRTATDGYRQLFTGFNTVQDIAGVIAEIP